MYYSATAFAFTMFANKKIKRDKLNKKILKLILLSKGVSNIIYRSYINEFVYESDSIEELTQEISKDFPNLGGFEVYEVKNPGTPEEEEKFYALINY